MRAVVGKDVVDAKSSFGGRGTLRYPSGIIVRGGGGRVEFLRCVGYRC